jgi:glycosyltransferase involved in cell wall biosynthesis
MRILILTQYYPPETGAPQNRLSDMAERLMRSGHDITVLTALPNYPEGKIHKDYRGRMIVEEYTQTIRIVRSWIYTTQNKSFVPRLVNYFSFVLSSLIVGIWKVGRQDFLIVESPPLFLGISGFLLSLLKKAKLVFNVSDLWPDSAVAIGVIKNNGLIRISRLLEEFLYRQSDLITGQTQGIIHNIRSRFVDKPVFLITNGVNVDAFRLASDTTEVEAIKREFELNERFVIGYAGLHGLAQGLETVIQAARLLAAREDLLFAFFGDGPEKHKLVLLTRECGLKNVRFYSSQATTRMPAIVGSFDVALVPLKHIELFKGALPSKMFEAMAAAVPVIVSIEGEARELVEKAQAGLAIEAEDPKAMADAILRLYKDKELRRNFGLNGRRYVVEYYNREKIALEFERLLIAIHRPEPVLA